MLEEERSPAVQGDVGRTGEEGSDLAGEVERGGAERDAGGEVRAAAAVPRRSRQRRTVLREVAEAPRSFTPQQRLLLLDVWMRSKLSAADFSALAGVSPHSLYTWKKKFEADGPAGLVGRKRGAPKGSRLPEPTRRAILLLKQAHPEWGRDRIHHEMMRAEGLEASSGAIGKVLEDEGYVVEEVATRKHAPPVKRFEYSKPGQLWQTDLFTFTLKGVNRRVHLVAYLDDHSRFVTTFALSASSTGTFVRDALEAGVASHGAPREVLTDRGPQYVTWRGVSAFTKLCERRGIKQIKSRPRHPQTLGKIERFWKTLWEECLKEAVFRNLVEARTRVGHYVDHYNFQRTHQGIGGLVPADRFYGAAPEVREALHRRVADNALELARHGEPRKPFYLTGRVGDEAISLHAEGERVVLVREDGTREEVDLAAPGRRVEVGEAPGMPEPLSAQGAVRDHPAVSADGKEECDEEFEEREGESDGGEAEEAEDAADGTGGVEGQPAGDEALGGDRADAGGAFEPDGDERGALDLAQPLLPVGDPGAAGAGERAGAQAAGPADDAGARAGPAQGGDGEVASGVAALPGAGPHGAAHDRTCEDLAQEGRIGEEPQAPAAGAGEDGAQDDGADAGAEGGGQD